MGGVAERDVLDVEGAAGFLGFAPYTIREMAREGRIPATKVGREWRFSRRLLVAMVEGAHHEEQAGTSEKGVLL